MSLRLNGCVALVTGASSGIGEATAHALSQAGAAVALVARRADRLHALSARITAAGGNGIVLPADITDADAARDVVERTVRELGSLDVLVNNAGMMFVGPISDAPLDEWERMIAINQHGLLYVTHAALPHLMHAAENGSRRVADIVNVSSVAGRVARTGLGVYNMTKFGVVAFGESLRQEVTRRHVRVSTIEPGVVATELLGHNREAVRAPVAERFGSIEQLEPEDVADAITYVVTRPRRVAINELLVRPTMQDW